ncbi:ATPase, histidine kinase-, DNA gyrase B-, and HSP90-like domain protein [Synechococcus sp. PCC 7335]|uniref:GAF domain-containing sensor histidine kinase n=1 Tax=Synechococcus sp. (strain ATCC 29403 / PCC 7335) TaxID=91464 RepID=UPI00017EE3C9|nr:ATP-binding protein [Synechococcus sp. PCC 7335]EDX84271.1 ATPase, histidine kinase-, DNA gyrase B-, and HSP90-like domain protein [Synechococcus sp. PCC 7335]
MSRSVHPPSNSIDLAVVSGIGSATKTAETGEQLNTLVVVHTVEGEILSMHWPQAADCIEYVGEQGSVDQSVEQSVEVLFGPVAVVPYMEHVRQVVEQQSPQEFQCVVRCGHQPVGFDFVLSPLPANSAIPRGDGLQVDGNSAVVVGVGRRTVPQPLPIVTTNSVSNNGGSGYYALLASVASDIRKTLDLKTIWQQTVNGLGSVFKLDRCLVCDYSQEMQTVTVVAEYYQPNLHPCLGKTFALSAKADFLNTLQSLKPVIKDFRQSEGELPYTVLTIATCYREQPNSILVLQQPPRQPWQSFEIDLIHELTDQVGTAIAHAKLFSESEAITRELRTKSRALRQTNSELTRKHQELEEAKRQAEEASRRKSDFLANTSHELRTPLNGMIGFLRLVLDDMADDEEEQLEFIQESHNSAIHLLNLINDVLDIAKIEANKMELELSAVSLKELMEEIDKSQRTHIENRGLEFNIVLPATLDEIKLYSNYQRLKQVLLNLVSNASKFTHEGNITITAEINPQSFEFDKKTWPGLVKISVADTGIGVSLEKQDRLFQTFSQVDSARTRQYEGTGLGLAISQRLVEAMGGKVKFISMGEGLGSTVSFTTILYQEPVMELGAT